MLTNLIYLAVFVILVFVLSIAVKLSLIHI